MKPRNFSNRKLMRQMTAQHGVRFPHQFKQMTHAKKNGAIEKVRNDRAEIEREVNRQTA